MSRPAYSKHVLSRILAKAPLFFGILLLLTGGVLVWHHYGMERVYELSGNSGHTVAAMTDAEGGGMSTATMTRENGALRMKCNLIKKVEWPYCKFAFTLGNGNQGVDLSKYDYFTLDASYPGEGKRHMRVSIVNFQHGLSIDEDWRTHKMIEIDAFEMPANGHIAIPMSLFHTAVWWKEIARLPILRTDVRLDNAILVLVQTAAYNTLGEQDITVHALRFHGKIISQAELLGIITAMWIISAIAWPAFMAIALRRELDHSKAEVKQLADLNRALKLETAELAGQAQMDALTGVLNRQGLRSLLMHSSTMLTPPMSIVFLDIDHFKKVNDQQGHQVGDMVLQQFAAVIGGAIRSNDKLVRWGGEEFLLLCPMTDVVQAAALAEKLRTTVEFSKWPNGLRITASFGVAQHEGGEDIGEVIERADAELYSAKAAGRNRVHAYGLAQRVAA